MYYAQITIRKDEEVEGVELNNGRRTPVKIKEQVEINSFKLRANTLEELTTKVTTAVEISE
jgi:hypothetical protein